MSLSERDLRKCYPKCTIKFDFSQRRPRKNGRIRIKSADVAARGGGDREIRSNVIDAFPLESTAVDFIVREGMQDSALMDGIPSDPASALLQPHGAGECKDGQL